MVTTCLDMQRKIVPVTRGDALDVVFTIMPLGQGSETLTADDHVDSSNKPTASGSGNAMLI